MGKAITVGNSPVAPGRPPNAIELARALGDSSELPDKQLADTPALIAAEQDMLLKCESALENLRFAFWAAGKALQVVRDARLYRAQFTTFEEYTQTRWDITPQYAGKLIRTWRVAESLFLARPGGDLETIVSKRLGYAQAWALVPLVEAHSVKAATYLYLALLKAKGAQVTAALVQGAVEALPKEAMAHQKRTEEAVAAYLAALEGEGTGQSAIDPVKTVRALTKASKSFNAAALKAAMEHSPEKTRQAVRTLIETLSETTGIEVIIAPESEPQDAGAPAGAASGAGASEDAAAAA
ncbi:hypothetical protein ACH4FX_37550 [Streptomyces sp. NPDC018019]|uniref:hypothetical protein n=1 Tax=Streptomyces sp. NPDC018019 TaxID=3365030 RepID=UPI00378851D9